MAEVGNKRDLLQFGAWVIEPQLSRIRSGEMIVHLQPQAIEVLAHLLDHPGEIVSQQDLMDVVWDGRLVEPGAVARNVAAIRKALGDDPRNPTYIQTVPKRGYRMIATVTPGPRRLPKSIAVLPFENLSPDPDNAYFAAGIHEEILSQLAKIRELSVIARKSVRAYADSAKPIPQIGRELNVSFIMEGSVRYAGERVRITAQLIDADSDLHLWSEVYDRNLEDVFAIQAEIAQHVATELSATLLAPPKFPTTSTRAYTNYLQAKALLDQFDASNHDVVARLLDEALEEDPKFSLAWVGLSRLVFHRCQVGTITWDEYRIAHRSAILNALIADPTGPEALTQQAVQFLQFDRDRASAARSFVKALRLAPTNVEVLKVAMLMALNLGRVEQAIELGEQAIMRDPLCPVCHGNLAQAYMYAGRLSKALEHAQMRRSLAPRSRGASILEAFLTLHKGKAKAALAKFQALPEDSIRTLGLFMALHDLGRTGEAQSQLRELREDARELQPRLLAQAYAWMGDTDEAFNWLDKSKPADDLLFDYQRYLNLVLRRLSNDRRWQEYLIRTGAAPETLEAIDFDFALPSHDGFS